MIAPNNTDIWIKDNVETWIKENLFEVIPMAIAVIDREFNIVYANISFAKMFGEWRGNKCYKVYKRQNLMCQECKGSKAFEDGASHSNEEVGFNKSGALTRYIKHTIPIKDENENIHFLIEMITDITEIERIRKERQLLFDRVPCNILLIDRNFRITRTNKQIREMFGNIEGEYCYEAMKGLDKKCSECTAQLTFSDGKTHVGHSTVKTKEGETVQFQVTTVPLDLGDGKFDLVMEMAVDITQTLKLKDELKVAYAFLEVLIATSIDGIIAVDNKGYVRLFNPAARGIFHLPDGYHVTREEIEYMLPDGFMSQVSAGPGQVLLPETEVKTIEGHSIPVRLAGRQLKVDGDYMGMAFSIQDLRDIKRLESEKIEAERLATVGQTVAGLAHGVKNLITSLDGGMYILSSGLKNGNMERIENGLEMLSRNIERISIFVKEFLGFSKGREIFVSLTHAEKIAEEVVEMYKTKAHELGIELIFEKIGEIGPAPMDYESMHECLTNLVGNAIDACQISDEKGHHVWVRVLEKDGEIIYEVADDGCGMDYEVKKKVFTTFFTTKGLGGTGLGLLSTKKIVQEHGGKISLESQKGKGSTFRIHLSRTRLPKLLKDEQTKIE